MTQYQDPGQFGTKNYDGPLGQKREAYETHDGGFYIPPARKKTRWGIIGISVLSFLAIVMVLIALLSQGHTATPAPVRSNTTLTHIVTQVVTNVVQPAGTVIQDFSGHQNARTGVFFVPVQWTIEWSCTPLHSTVPGDSTLLVAVLDNNGTPLTTAAVNEQCTDSNTSGTSSFATSGYVQLQVTSDTSWHLKIVH